MPKVPTAPYVMVKINSIEHNSLLAIGWYASDQYDGWLHMEPKR